MKGYLVETDVCIDILRRKKEAMEWLSNLTGKPLLICISSITAAEIAHGAYKMGGERLERALTFLDLMDVIPFGLEAAKHYGMIKADLERKGKVISDFDLINGCIAICEELILVTRNIRHFNRLKNYGLESKEDRRFLSPDVR